MRKYKSNAVRKELEGRGPADMTVVLGAKCRASNKVVRSAGRAALQFSVDDTTFPDTGVCTDDEATYEGNLNPH
ncbi:MAG: hypothetical protein OXL68_06590 [Paracoccaceae bacterium]|nr:hypothetical protein [Paracoccaceae bacterium]